MSFAPFVSPVCQLFLLAPLRPVPLVKSDGVLLLFSFSSSLPHFANLPLASLDAKKAESALIVAQLQLLYGVGTGPVTTSVTRVDCTTR